MTSFNTLTRAKCMVMKRTISGCQARVSIPSHGLSAWLPNLRIKRPQKRFNTLTRAKCMYCFNNYRRFTLRFNTLTRAKCMDKPAQKLFFSVLLSLCISLLYFKISHPSIIFQQILRYFLSFPAPPTGANLPISVRRLRPQQHKSLKKQAFSTGANHSSAPSVNPILLSKFRILPLTHFKSTPAFSPSNFTFSVILPGRPPQPQHPAGPPIPGGPASIYPPASHRTSS